MDVNINCNVFIDVANFELNMSKMVDSAFTVSEECNEKL